MGSIIRILISSMLIGVIVSLLVSSEIIPQSEGIYFAMFFGAIVGVFEAAFNNTDRDGNSD